MMCLVCDIPEQCVTQATYTTSVIDSGATSHIFNDRNLFSSLKNIEPFEIRIGDSSDVKASGRGSKNINLSVLGKP